MRSIAREMGRKEKSYELLVRGEAMSLCALIERELGGPSPGGGRKASEEAFPALERMQLAIDYIYERSAYPITLADAAKAASLSPSYFSRVFARTAGMSFRAFLNGIRIERAEALMRDSEARIADIALECGFESVRTFNRSFRALRGERPRELRDRAAGRLREAGLGQATHVINL
jgi:AraC-like DNA-binding protein